MPKKRHCKICGSFKTIKKGSRRRLKRYQYKDCSQWFSIDHRKKDKSVIEDHINGKPIRKIADKERKSKFAINRKLAEQIQKPQHNNSIAKRYCNRFCGIIVVDGKYTKVRGYEKAIPLLWDDRLSDSRHTGFRSGSIRKL